MKEFKEWDGFEGKIWKEEINTRDFIQKNYTPYDGDESFLAGPTDATNQLWGELQKLQKEERANNGVLDMETEVVSSLTAYGPGYIKEELKDLEKIVGLQTDKPLKRAFMPYGGIKMAEQACTTYGYTPNPKFNKIFNEYHKTHNAAVFDAYTPEMKKAGYDPNFSAAVNISSATTGMTIPPSNVLIVYSLASGGVSVSALFMAGYLPGILTGVAIMIVAAMFAARKGYPVGVRVPFSEATRVFFRAIPSLMLLVIVIGGILAGLFTATEASAIAVLYALILSFIYKELTWAKLPQVLLRSAKTTAIVLLLVATCTGLSWIMSYENIPQTVSAALLSISDNPVVILILINVILLIVGIFMDMTPAVLIFTPIFLPIATGQLGMDPVHFGIMMVLNLCVGLCTPPVGSVLFIGCSVAGTKIDQVIRPLLPMFAAMVIVLFLVAFLPDLSLLIPRLFGL